MRHIDGQIYYTIGEVATMIDRGAQTIKNWYAWEEREQTDFLPQVFMNIDEKKTRYFKEQDVPNLIKFRDKMKYGMMSDFNREKWGKRGKKEEEN